MADSTMYRILFVLITLVFLQGCSGQTTSYLSSGLTFATGGTTAKNILATGINFYVENKTGKNTFQHVADKTLESDIRECEITHSAEINEIFFKTLDQIDCKLN
tara:strand:+ start:494 stop:805 length:312 start_codon:yes stop_codon:yes gene_type:complete